MFCPHCGGNLEAVRHPSTTGEFAPISAVGPRSGADACSWCGKPSAQVRKLLTGPGVQICDECVALCHMVLRDELPGFGEK